MRRRDGKGGLSLVCALGWVLGMAAGLGGCGEEVLPELNARQAIEQGWQAYAGGDYAAAMLQFERAVAQAPALAEAYNGLGWSRLGQSQEFSVGQPLLEQALDAFQEALRRDPEHADAWVGLANVLFLRRKSQRDFVQAIEALEQVASLGDSPWLYRHDYHSPADLIALKAACLYYLGDDASARKALAEVLRQDPAHPTAIALRTLVEGE